jgi:shikimate 5-dehydrogenase
MPEQLAHASTCTTVPWERERLELVLTIQPHPKRTGAVNMTWLEKCPLCGRYLSYNTEVVAYRNCLKETRLSAVVAVSTWLQRQGLWGDQPLPDLS